MDCLKLKEVSEMVFRYMQDNKVNLLTAYEAVALVLQKSCPYSFTTVKQYLFDHDLTKIPK